MHYRYGNALPVWVAYSTLNSRTIAQLVDVHAHRCARDHSGPPVLSAALGARHSRLSYLCTFGSPRCLPQPTHRYLCACISTSCAIVRELSVLYGTHIAFAVHINRIDMSRPRIMLTSNHITRTSPATHSGPRQPVHLPSPPPPITAFTATRAALYTRSYPARTARCRTRGLAGTAFCVRDAYLKRREICVCVCVCLFASAATHRRARAGHGGRGDGGRGVPRVRHGRHVRAVPEDRSVAHAPGRARHARGVVPGGAKQTR